MLTSLIRTLVPIIVGFLLSLPIATKLGVSSDEATQFITAVVTAAYYVIVRALEHYGNPNFGWLLGAAKAPTYPPAAP